MRHDTTEKITRCLLGRIMTTILAVATLRSFIFASVPNFAVTIQVIFCAFTASEIDTEKKPQKNNFFSTNSSSTEGSGELSKYVVGLRWKYD